MDEIKAQTFHSKEQRAIITVVKPPHDNPIAIVLSMELERAATNARRLRSLLSRLDPAQLERFGPGWRSWEEDAERDEERLAVVLGRLDVLLGG
jgi:hypothetical protein